MRVQPISFTPIKNNYSQSSSRKNFSTQPNDSVSFTNYTTIMARASRASLERESNLEKYFGQIMQDIWTDSNMVTTEAFSTITDIYIKKGLRNTLMEFWTPNPSKVIKKITDNFDNNLSIPLVTMKKLVNVNIGGTVEQIEKGETAVKLIYMGKQGFLNSIMNKDSAPRDIRLSFSNNDNYVELYLDKKGDLTVEQLNNEEDILTSFHSLTGHRKQVSKLYEDGQYEATYYNTDGSKSFWKNFLFGRAVTTD